ncbi:alpha-2-macroglobulin family protein [Planktothrix mougeotii]|uniref:Alpha-2-macroglobulin family protein n=1 Tax=Planktothrix mougeotii LEGE 06226 TaxID=1828728 RepID=A0ABR9UGA0_9CYAN|nr:alpha-2-macroglobulin [Planktothrix mougeotii]MBE9145487.1 alpha-2-macroglobulin family protein [Planktothrix mougeotii LEGE 06226]
MRNFTQFRLIRRRFIFVFLFILTLVGCRIISHAPVSEVIPMVADLPKPQLPNWIETINPLGDSPELSQIHVIFKDPLIPVESLDSSRQKKLLKNFEITPKIPGEFRFLTPKMVGFQADKALPLATRLQVTLRKGLTDLNQHELDQDIAWTFATEPIKLSNLPGSKEQPGSPENPLGLNPQLKFNSNVELDLNSLQEHLKLISQKINQVIPVEVKLVESEENKIPIEPNVRFNPAAQPWEYIVTPKQPLQTATQYQFKITPGLRPAQGNLETQVEISSLVKTYDTLKFISLELPGKASIEGTFGRFVTGNPQLQFNNGIIAESALKNITLKPAPKANIKLIQAYDNNDIITLNPWALEPQTNYTITLGGELEDQFNQKLGKPVTITHKTGDLTPDIFVPSGLNIFPSQQDLQLNISTLNLPQSQYQASYNVVQPTDLVYTDSAYPRTEGKTLLLPVEKWATFEASTPKNKIKETPINLREKLGGNTGMLAYGVTAKTTQYQREGQQKWSEPQFYGLVQLTNLGVFAQWFPESGLVRVHHLDNGSVAEKVSVDIYPSQLEAKSYPQPKVCATGTTDEQGMLVLNSQQLQQCMKGKRFAKAPALLVIAKEGKDWAFTRTFSDSGAYGYGIYANWEDQQILSRGVIFSDRQLYKPGEKIALTGIAYSLEQGILKPNKNESYTVTLENPNKQTQTLGEYKTNEFATFSVELPLTENQPLGNYIVRAKNQNGVEILGNFRVAEFKPPNFKVNLNLTQKFAQIGETITANAKSEYLFGSPVAEGLAQYYVTRTATDFSPKGWDNYSFGRQWFWPEEKPNVSDSVLQENQALDDQGWGSKTVTVAKDLPYPMTYRVDVEVTDISNLSVANSQSFIALPSHRLIGLKTPFIGEAGKALPIDIIVTDDQGKPLENVGVNLQLQKMDYSRVTRVVEGAQTDKNQIQYQTVDQIEVTSGAKEKTVSLTPSESGSYRIQANFSDTKDEITATDLQIWVTGNQLVDWGGVDENRLEIKLNKTTYKPGETATALIQSPYPEAELYFAVVRDKPLYETVMKVKGSAPEIKFQVTPEMLPNAAVEAVLVRQGKPISELEPGSLENLAKIGLTPFNINLEDQYLKVQVNPQQNKLEPSSEQTLNLTLTDAKNQPVRGQLTVMVVNDSILQLNGYRPPNLIETVYADQPISTRFSDNRPAVILNQVASPLAKGWGYGGGLSTATANPRIRKEFQPLAFYNGSIVTDNQGKATVNFKVPDDLTTWRVMVVATDGNLKFGSGDATFITTQALISNPILPQFARPGDRILAGLSITNLTEEQGNLNITGTVNGGIQFSPGNTNQQTLKTTAEAGTNAYRFPILVKQAGNAKVEFKTEFNNKFDGFEVPLEVKPFNVIEQVIESGRTTNSITIPLNISKKVVPDVGGLEINLASTLIPQLTAAAEQVFNQDEWPFLEPAVSELLIAANLEILGKKYNQNFSKLQLSERAKTALAQIKTLQKENGGIAAYPGSRLSDPLLSAYTGEALSQAEKAGFSVDSQVINSLKTYLIQGVDNPGKYDFCTEDVCKNEIRLNALIALDNLGEKRSDFLDTMLQNFEEFDAVNQIKLVRYLSQFPQWKEEYNRLFEQVQKQIYITGRTATLNFPQGYRWLNSPTTIQSQGLRLAIAQNPQSQTVDKLVQSLLNLRQDGTWGSSYNNAQALTALVAYADTETTPPNFNVAIQLGNQILGETQFKGYKDSSYRLNVPMSELPKGKNDLILQQSNQGLLNYWVAYRYRLEGNQPGRLNGLRITRTIRPANEDKVLQTIDLNSPQQLLKVQPGQVFDIGLDIITDHPIDQVMITDPLPAGFEAIDASFKTSNLAVQAQKSSWQINYQTIYKDRIIAYSDRLEPGIYQLHYLVRSVTPGEYLWPGAEAQLQYTPEEFGRSASTTLLVSKP